MGHPCCLLSAAQTVLGAVSALQLAPWIPLARGAHGSVNALEYAGWNMGRNPILPSAVPGALHNPFLSILGLMDEMPQNPPHLAGLVYVWVGLPRPGLALCRHLGEEAQQWAWVTGLCFTLTACNACLDPGLQRALGPSGGHKAGKLEGAKGSYLPCAHLILSRWLEHLTLSDPQRLAQSQACQASGVGDGWTGGWITVDSLSHTLSLPWPKFPRRFGDTRSWVCFSLTI